MNNSWYDRHRGLDLESEVLKFQGLSPPPCEFRYFLYNIFRNIYSSTCKSDLIIYAFLSSKKVHEERGKRIFSPFHTVQSKTSTYSLFCKFFSLILIPKISVKSMKRQGLFSQEILGRGKTHKKSKTSSPRQKEPRFPPFTLSQSFLKIHK